MAARQKRVAFGPLLLVLLSLAAAVSAVPLRSHHSFGDSISIAAKPLTSRSARIPLDYGVLPMCPTPQFRRPHPLGLGELLLGGSSQESPYSEVVFGRNVTCAVVCGPRLLDEAAQRKLNALIADGYNVNLAADGLSLILASNSEGTMVAGPKTGVPLGAVDPRVSRADDQPGIVYNHLSFIFEYVTLTDNKDAVRQSGSLNATGVEAARYRIVTFAAAPHSDGGPSRIATCKEKNANARLWLRGELQRARAAEIVFTYSVTWRQVTQADLVARQSDKTRVQMFSAINNACIAVFLIAIIVTTVSRNLSDPDPVEAAEAQPFKPNVWGRWRLLHADVFRPPFAGRTRRTAVLLQSLLAALVGTGVQLHGTATIVVALCVFVGPIDRGQCLTAAIVSYALLGVFGGFAATQLMRVWDGTAPSMAETAKTRSTTATEEVVKTVEVTVGTPLIPWAVTLLTATLIPGLAFAVLLVNNALAKYQGGVHAVTAPPTVLITVAALWLGVEVPLVLLGARWGCTRAPPQLPVDVSPAPPRPLPTSPAVWYLSPALIRGAVVPACGAIPFGAVFIETVFFLASLWCDREHSGTGFVLLTLAAVTVACIGTTVSVVTCLLAAEDHRWWVAAFVSSGGGAAHLLLYTVYFYGTRLAPPLQGVTALVLYFSTMGLVAVLFFAMTGAIGFIAAFFMLRYLYSNVKTD